MRIVSAALAASVLTVCVAAQTPAVNTTVRKAPELAFKLPGGQEKLLSQYRGKVLALEFILTTCPHCQAQVPVLDGLMKKYGPQGFQAIDVAINAYDEDPKTDEHAGTTVSNFQMTYGAQFPVGFVQREAMDPFMNFSIMDRTVVPQVVLIDRKGMIHYQTPPSGESDLRNASFLEAKIQELLNQKDTVSATHHPAQAKRAAS